MCAQCFEYFQCRLVVRTPIYLSVLFEYTIKVQTIGVWFFFYYYLTYNKYRIGYFSDITHSKVVMCFVKNILYRVYGAYYTTKIDFKSV